MDSHNLAILFGPNILHKSKGGQFEVESVERAEERAEVIGVVKEMIDHQSDIFEVRASSRHKPRLENAAPRLSLAANLVLFVQL